MKSVMNTRIRSSSRNELRYDYIFVPFPPLGPCPYSGLVVLTVRFLISERSKCPDNADIHPPARDDLRGGAFPIFHSGRSSVAVETVPMGNSANKKTCVLPAERVCCDLHFQIDFNC